MTASICSGPGAEGRKENSPSPPFPARDVFQTAVSLEWENRSSRQVIWVSVREACEFLDYQSYLHSNICIQTHPSPNIVQALYDAGVGRQDLCRPYGYKSAAELHGLELKYGNISVSKKNAFQRRGFVLFLKNLFFFFCIFAFSFASSSFHLFLLAL